MFSLTYEVCALQILHFDLKLREFPSNTGKEFCLFLSHASAKMESKNNKSAAQGTITELHPAAH